MTFVGKSNFYTCPCQGKNINPVESAQAKARGYIRRLEKTKSIIPFFVRAFLL